MPAPSTSVKSAQRVLELLEYFAEWRRPSTVKEISQSLGYPGSSTSVLLRSLRDSGYFDHDARTGLYRPNVRLSLATAWIQEQLYTEGSLLHLMERLLETTGHTVMIGTLHNSQVRYLHVLQSIRVGGFPARDNMARTGSLRPLFLTASGKMLLTTVPERDVQRLLTRANAHAQDAAQRVSLQQALQDRSAALRDRHAVSLGTGSPGAGAVAVLLPVPRGHEPLTLSLGGPLKEIRKECTRLADILRDEVEPFSKVSSTG